MKHNNQLLQKKWVSEVFSGITRDYIVLFSEPVCEQDSSFFCNPSSVLVKLNEKCLGGKGSDAGLDQHARDDKIRKVKSVWINKNLSSIFTTLICSYHFFTASTLSTQMRISSIIMSNARAFLFNFLSPHFQPNIWCQMVCYQINWFYFILFLMQSTRGRRTFSIVIIRIDYFSFLRFLR